MLTVSTNSEVLTAADEEHRILKHNFIVPFVRVFVCGCRNLGEALRRIGEGAATTRTESAAAGCSPAPDNVMRTCRAPSLNVTCAVERERPELWRRPREVDQEQHQRLVWAFAHRQGLLADTRHDRVNVTLRQLVERGAKGRRRRDAEGA